MKFIKNSKPIFPPPALNTLPARRLYACFVKPCQFRVLNNSQFLSTELRRGGGEPSLIPPFYQKETRGYARELNDYSDAAFLPASRI